eukprot:TRINITY_DN8206_c0_g1_i1.p4 TRINITY_DN8206_c0_g1~~TRINITY_DN8206_c0_g1_i1.p4  ORF type:complete len:62 (+),score=9.51 TRINITY_DN8206_c0_g1_i1:259-444(+)
MVVLYIAKLDTVNVSGIEYTESTAYDISNYPQRVSPSGTQLFHTCNMLDCAPLGDPKHVRC